MRIGEFTAPIVGRICMDQALADVTGIPEVYLGLLSEILLRWSITGKTAGFLPLVLQSKQEASAISC